MYLTKGMRDVFIFAWRYAVNRRTFARKIVFDEIQRRLACFEDWELKDMIEECRHPINRACVDDCDLEEMDRVAEYLQKVLAWRAQKEQEEPHPLGRQEGLYVPIIRVRDNDTGKIHVVGSDRHDALIIRHGLIQYINLQNHGRTLANSNGTYEFVGYENPYGDELACRWYSPTRIARISSRLVRWQSQINARITKLLSGMTKKRE